jgi:hypothetical protein
LVVGEYVGVECVGVFCRVPFIFLLCCEYSVFCTYFVCILSRGVMFVELVRLLSISLLHGWDGGGKHAIAVAITSI